MEAIYAESSAVLAWLLGEDAGEPVRAALGRAELVIWSSLTLVECERVLIRAVALDEMGEAEAADARAHLQMASAHWSRLGLDHKIIERARQPFPNEPLRTLDALHLAAALRAASAIPGLQLLSLDQRLRSAAKQLGFRAVPD